MSLHSHREADKSPRHKTLPTPHSENRCRLKHNSIFNAITLRETNMASYWVDSQWKLNAYTALRENILGLIQNT